MGRQVLLIIDPQNDFTSSGGNYAGRHAGISQILEAKSRIRKLLDMYSRSEAIIVKSDYKPDQFAMGLSICIPGTFGHEIDPDLILDDRVTFTKTKHSCFSSGDFLQHLRSNNIDLIFVCGFLAEYCVKQTVQDALELGYKVMLVDDCIGTGDDVQNRKRQTIQELAVIGALVVNSKDLNSVDQVSD